MPIELRRIIFDTQELREAILSLNRAKKQKLPAGDLQVTEIIGDEDVQVRLAITNSSGTVHELQFESADLSAALLIYCKEHQIPIPRSFEKSLSSRDGKLVFNLKNTRKIKAASKTTQQGQTAAA